MASRYFELYWSDLSYEKQQEMITSVKESLLEDLKEEGKAKLKSQLVNRTGKTNEVFWKEWQAEHKATDEQMILVALNELYDFEDVTEDWDWIKEGQNYKSIEYDLDTFAEEKAEEACQKGIRHMEIEVEL